MVNAESLPLPQEADSVSLVRDNLDTLLSYATHLVGSPDDAVEFVASGMSHMAKFPPSHIDIDGTATLYRAVTRACRQRHYFPPRIHGPIRFFRRSAPPLRLPLDTKDVARVNTVKRSLMTINFDRRAALLLRNFVQLSYREIARVVECSPETAARLVAGARRDFGTVYRDISL